MGCKSSVQAPAAAPGSPKADARQNPSIGGSMEASTFTLERSSTHATMRLRCAERDFDGQDELHPVQLVVFDLDETITLATFMTRDGVFPPEKHGVLTKYNFETPWVEGSRIGFLQQMFKSLLEDEKGQCRALAILSRNKSGVMGVMNLLKMANLAEYFSAMWTLPFDRRGANGVYLEDGEWKSFDPPVQEVHDHKADVLQHVADNPAAWFPQLNSPNQTKYISQLSSLRPEGIVLVDDQRANFQSDTGAQVQRYAKVARYDADYHHFGPIENMGGIGARNDADYETLRRFVEDPWMCKETQRCRCLERDFPGAHRKHPVQLVVFDFDETLTLATFMPKDEACSSTLKWTPSGEETDDFDQEDLVRYNFETPYVDDGVSRIAKLQTLFTELRTGTNGERRTLAILTRNESGVIAVLNLLHMAGLAEHFSAVWATPWREDQRNGVYQKNGEWIPFDPPADKVPTCHKADILHDVVENASAWFPQFAAKGSEDGFGKLRPEGFVLVDDERANLRSYSTQAKVLRYCKVARYDEAYRDCGVLNQMGGIGAHSDEDYESLRLFVESPWDFPYETSSSHPGYIHPKADSEGQMGDICRSEVSEEMDKVPRARSTTSIDAMVGLGCLSRGHSSRQSLDGLLSPSSRSNSAGQKKGFSGTPEEHEFPGLPEQYPERSERSSFLVAI